MHGITERETRQGKIVSQILSLIFYLNNHQKRYEFRYSGYKMVLSKFNFDLKEFEELIEVNATGHSYSYTNKILAEMLKVLEDVYEVVNTED